jgi:hypothetical protein
MKRLWLLLFLVFVPSLWSADSVSQRTSGCGSPIVDGVKGNVEIKIVCKQGVDPATVKLIVQFLNEGLPRIEQQQKQIIQLLSTKILDTQQLQELIAMKYAAVFASSKEDSEKWAKELLESAQAKEAELRSLSVTGKELSEKLSLQWKPMYDFILKEFDDRASALAARNLFKAQAKPEHNLYYKGSGELMVIDRPAKAQVWLRDVRFPNDGIIQIFLDSGRIHRGKFIGGPVLYFQESVNGIRFKPFRYRFETSELTLYPEVGGGGKIHKPNNPDPLLDQEFRGKISTAIGNSIQFIYLNDAASR